MSWHNLWLGIVEAFYLKMDLFQMFNPNLQVLMLESSDVWSVYSAIMTVNFETSEPDIVPEV